MIRRRQKEQGAALILAAMAAIVILFAVIMAQIRLQELSTRSSLILRNDVQARESARSGLEMALEQIRTRQATGSPVNYTFVATLPQSSLIAGQTNHGPNGYRLANGCTSWWFGLYDPAKNTIRVHVAGVAPYVDPLGRSALAATSADPFPTQNCDLGTLVGTSSVAGTSFNPQRGVIYLLSATISTTTDNQGSAANGSFAPKVLSVSYEKRTFNL